MNTKKTKGENPIKLAVSTAIAALMGAYAWMILLHTGVEMYQIKKLGSKAMAQSASEQMFSNNTGLIITSYVVMEILILLITCLMVKRYKQDKLKPEDIGMRWDNNSFKDFAYGFGMALVMYACIYVVLNASGIVHFLGYGCIDGSPLKAIGTVILMFVVTAFPGFCEEILFRGVIQNYLMKKMSTPVSLLISSLLFSLMHIGQYQNINLLTIIIIGIVMGYIFSKTKSLYLPIGLHFAYDFAGSIVGVEKSMFNTNYLLVFRDVKNGEFWANVVIMSVYLLLLVIMIAKYNRGKGFTANQA